MVVLISGDLMLTSQVSGPAQQAGVTLTTVSRIEQLADAAEQESVAGVILELTDDGPSPADVVGTLAEPRPKLIAFGSHVRTDLLQAAKDAGFDEVLPRGQFVGGALGVFQGLARE